MNTKCFHIGLSIWIFAAVSIGFAETFQNRPTLTELNETVNQAIVCGNAVIERDVVVNRNQNFFPYCGHGQSYFASLQTELENLPTLYVDHVNGPLTTNQVSFLYFTLSTWQEVAGLSTNGFRRATEQGGGFSYGHAQAGDVIGYWIYEDIAAGFSALQWTRWSSVYSAEWGDKNTWDGDWGVFQTKWTAKEWVINGGDPKIYWVSAGEWGGGNGSPPSIGAKRYRSKIGMSGLPPMPCAADIFFSPRSGGMTFTDIDGLGFQDLENKTWFWKIGLTLNGEATYITEDYIGDIETNPWYLLGWTPWLIPYVGRSAGCYFSDPGSLMKWNFTY